MENQQSGRSLRRFEDRRFLTGRGRYVDDVSLPGQAHAYVLRSPHAHAAIAAIDLAAARALPGVLGVFSEADLRAEDIGPLPSIAQISTIGPLVSPPRYALARDRVRHVGDPVVLVVATSRDIARDAAELVEIDYRALPSVPPGPAALAPDAPQLWDEAPGNLAFRFEKGDRAATAAGFAAAAHIVTLDLVNNRVVPAPLETRAAIGSYDAPSRCLELLASAQSIHVIRDILARRVFHLPLEQIQVIAPDVGGGFGMKNFLYPEWVLVLWAARRLERPVKWVADRAEDFLSSAQGRDNYTTARLALDDAGRFLALEVETLADLGAYLSTESPVSATNAPASAMGGLYRIPAIFMAVRGALTNTVPIDAYRGAGKPEANYLIERLIDLAAEALGSDPVTLRRQNLIAAFPHRTAMGLTIDCGRFADHLDAATLRADRASFPARRQAAAARGKLRGLGVACFLETARGKPDEGAEIRFEADGGVALLLGTQSNGQGHETSYPQIAADLLGLPIESFRLVQADTRTVRRGSGHGGARSMHQGGSALVRAAEGVIEKARILAARLLQANPAELTFAAGRFTVGATDRAITLLEVARAARDPANRAEGAPAGLDTYVLNPLDLYTFPNGCHVAEVEIDPETGRVALERYTIVDDYGRLINPLLTAGQVQGGVVQGIGQALLEHTVYDPASGQLLSGSLMDYALPRADDLPPLEVTFDPVPTAANPLGVKGSGQAGCIGAPQTVMNAIADALRPLGIRHLDMPATPQRVWDAIQAARAAKP